MEYPLLKRGQQECAWKYSIDDENYDELRSFLALLY